MKTIEERAKEYSPKPKPFTEMSFHTCGLIEGSTKAIFKEQPNRKRLMMPIEIQRCITFSN